MKELGRALRHRNYRLYFVGQGLSLVGTWLTKVATAWLVYRMTGSAWLLGVVGFAGQIPTFIVAPLAGALVDRWDRRRVLLATQSLAMVQSAALAALTLGGVIQIWELVALNVMQGLIDAFDMPTRQSMLVRMVEDRADLPNAIALNSSMVNGARLLGPAIAGVLIAIVGEGLCFLVDALSYGAVLVCVLLMRYEATPRPAHPSRVVSEIIEGFRYASRSPPIRSLLVLLALSGFAGRPFSVLLPVIASQVMRGGPGTLGALQSAAGFGALAGALYLASRTSVLGLGRVIVVATALFGLGLVAFSLAHVLALALPLLFVAGCGMMVQTAASNTILQTVVEEDKRGRVMSLLGMSLFGSVPLGSLAAGALAARIGADDTILVGGAVCCGAAVFFLRALPAVRRAVRPIYERMGILPASPEEH
jgi:MFS family permease